jgi:hypothetical protein
MLKTCTHRERSSGEPESGRGAVSRIYQESYTRPEDIFNDPRVNHQQKMKTLRNWDLNQKALLRAATEDMQPANDENVITFRQFSVVQEANRDIQCWMEEKWERDGL